MSGDDVGLIGFADSSDAASSANAAMQAGAWDEAVQHWARRRAEAPTDSAAYVRAALCLRRLARVEDAYALLQEAEARGIDDVRIDAAQAELAAKRSDWEEAERRWRAVLAQDERHQAAIIELARLLIDFGQGLEAEPMLVQAILRQPEWPDPLQVLADAAADRRDWILAEQRWRDMLAVFPDSVAAIIGLAVALQAMARGAEADALLAQAVDRHPHDALLLRQWARVAMAMENWAEAASRWGAVCTLVPDSPDDHFQVVSCLTAQKRYNEADALITEVLPRLPYNQRLARTHAQLSDNMKNWPVSSLRWQALLEREPGNQALRSRVARARKAAGQPPLEPLDPAIVSHAQGPQQPPNTPLTEEETTHLEDWRDLLMRFESLGQNCEFGLVQRRYKAEPLGLFRWASTQSTVLAAFLEADMKGMGAPEHTVVHWNGAEYLIRDSRYSFSTHTFIREQQADPKRFHDQQCRRLQFLTRKMRDDLGEGEKIFVRQTRQREDPRRIRRLYSAMRRHGPARLLFVQPAGEDYASGTVRRVTDGLAIGYHANISGVPWSIAYYEWVALCRNAARLFDEDLALVVGEDGKEAVVMAEG